MKEKIKERERKKTFSGILAALLFINKKNKRDFTNHIHVKGKFTRDF